MTSNVDRATAVTEDLIERGAPWSPNASWALVMAQGIGAALVGLIMLFKPLGGAATTLQLIGLILLGIALVASFQLWRRKVREDQVVLTAFRAGSGVTVGLIAVAATFLTAVTDQVAAALAVAIGVGFLVYGATGLAGSFAGRTTGESLPLVALVVNAVLAIAGLILILSGAAGPSAVSSTFTLLGIVLIVGGVAMGGYAYLLRQQEVSGVRA
jgi:uncharacterized membrane protein HdeD (DUF308 family)